MTRLEPKFRRRYPYEFVAADAVPAKAVQEQMLGIDWMTLHGLHQSLPPVYTQYLGAQLMAAVVAGQMAVAS